MPTLIISHRHRFIFMHCRKAAGSSVAAALAPYLDRDDLHLGTWPEALEAGIAPNRRARRDLMHPLAGASFLVRWLAQPSRLADRAHRVRAQNGAQRLKYRRVLGRSPEHAHAERVRAFAPGPWRDYFKFCFVRNPYARAVSDFRWRTAKRGARGLTFAGFLEALEREDFSHPAIPRHWDNWPIYTIDNKIALDFVGRFERLEVDLAEVFARLGLPAPRLGHAKASASGRPWPDWYGPDERARVERLFGREIEQFGYRFEAGAEAA